MDQNLILHKLMDVIQYKDNYQQQNSGIPSQDMYILEKIHFHKSIQIRDLAKNYGVPPSTLTGILDRLESKRFIQRIRSNNDRRAIELTMTKEGKALIQKHVHQDEVFVQNLYNTLPSERSKLLFDILNELLSKVEFENLFQENN